MGANHSADAKIIGEIIDTMPGNRIDKTEFTDYINNPALYNNTFAKFQQYIPELTYPEFLSAMITLYCQLNSANDIITDPIYNSTGQIIRNGTYFNSIIPLIVYRHYEFSDYKVSPKNYSNIQACIALYMQLDPGSVEFRTIAGNHALRDRSGEGLGLGEGLGIHKSKKNTGNKRNKRRQSKRNKRRQSKRNKRRK
jgi:hypothetical protein